MIVGPPSALLASVVAIFLDRPKGFAIAAVAISGLTCLLIGAMVVFAMVMAGQM
ncbi:MAG: hypothetical protein H8E44_16380 [Planctomycetes bacterium]|nr:hypothetical protein [Planctomycetota bacterium]